MKKILLAAIVIITCTTGFTCSKETPKEDKAEMTPPQEQMAAPTVPAEQPAAPAQEAAPAAPPAENHD